MKGCCLIITHFVFTVYFSISITRGGEVNAKYILSTLYTFNSQYFHICLEQQYRTKIIFYLQKSSLITYGTTPFSHLNCLSLESPRKLTLSDFLCSLSTRRMSPSIRFFNSTEKYPLLSSS